MKKDLAEVVQGVSLGSLTRIRSLFCIVMAVMGVFTPASWFFPWILGWVVLYGASAVLSTLDADFIREVSGEDPHQVIAVPAGPEAPEALLPAADRGGAAKLIGPSAEQYRHVAKLQKRILSQLDAAGDAAWIVASRQQLQERIEAVVEGFRRLCLTRQRLSRIIEGEGPQSVAAAMKDLEAKMIAAEDDEARSKYGRALAKRREQVSHLERIGAGLSRIDAQLANLLASLEAIHTRIAALSLDRQHLPEEERERLGDQLEALEDEASVLEEALSGFHD